jgi:hypothetical protein
MSSTSRKFDFHTSQYFSPGFLFAGAILLAFGGLLVFVQVWAGAILLAIGLVAVTTHYRLSVDLGKKVYRDYVWFLGLKVGASVPFEHIEYLFIKVGKESQTMRVRVASTILTKQVFDGYLRFSESDKVHIATRDRHEWLVRKLTPISQALDIPIKDYTAVS